MKSFCLAIFVLVVPLASGASAMLLKGAYYCRLDSGEGWEAGARVGSHADVVVRFEEPNSNFIFWRASSYLPHWQNDSNLWYVDEIVPRSGDGTGLMPDEINRYSRVAVIESSPARAIVYWRYIPDFANPGLDGWVEEYFTLYPDGVCIRTVKVAAGTTLPQWQDPTNVTIQRLQLLPEGISDLPAPWQTVPELTLTGSSVSDYNDDGFDEAKRCYVLECKNNGLPSNLEFTLDTTGGKSIHNPAVEVRNWGDADLAVTVDGNSFSDYCVGYAGHMNGSNLVLWLGKESTGSIDVSISPAGGSAPITRAPPPDFGYDFDANVPPLPMGSPDPGPFGAYYTRLAFNNRFDELWRVGEHSDVVVQFDDNAHRFVFWRGTNYGPHWASDASETPYSNWYGTQFVERRGSEWAQT